MHKKVKNHYRALLLPLLLAIVLGYALGQLAWTLVLALSIYLFWTLYQAGRLHNWLYTSAEKGSIPESYGLWGDLFEGLYGVQQDSQLAREKLEAMVERVELSTNALSDALITTDATGAIDWWNPATEALLGFQRGTDKGQLIHNLLRAPLFKAYFEAKQYATPLELDSPRNPEIKLRFYMTLFGNNERLVVAQDISHIHKLEQMRRDFVSNVSHEMRTPLTVIKGYLETMQDHSYDLPAKWQRALNTMQAQSNLLEVLVSDLLLLAKYETTHHASTQNAMDIVALVSMIAHDAKILSGDQQHEITFHCDFKGMFLGDEKQIRSAVSNIVFNAVKYTPAQGHIDIQMWRDTQGLQISVVDDGVGFDPMHIPRLTERFYRADPSRDKATGGSGLGLSIVKHVLLNHEGSLLIDSSPGQGSTFTCRFPSSRIRLPDTTQRKSA